MTLHWPLLGESHCMVLSSSTRRHLAPSPFLDRGTRPPRLVAHGVPAERIANTVWWELLSSLRGTVTLRWPLLGESDWCGHGSSTPPLHYRNLYIYHRTRPSTRCAFRGSLRPKIAQPNRTGCQHQNSFIDFIFTVGRSSGAWNKGKAFFPLLVGSCRYAHLYTLRKGDLFLFGHGNGPLPPILLCDFI
ncbi:hypothetical protein CAAN1_17S01420 [[Candida] anglica]|uniref:Uncharacterized protein n=1 Tax=[Candida] anglica TaxID=148631 RepID=A0ABP0E8S6_9ASCO